MSDLFKRHTPKLTEEEERALWERVRTMPREVGGAPAPARSGRSWWQGLFAMPAVRYGAPVLAVALVAVVWVVQQSPTPPARQRAVAPAMRADQAAPTPEGAPSSDARTEAPSPATRAVPAPEVALQKSLREKAKAEGGEAADELRLATPPPPVANAPAPSAAANRSIVREKEQAADDKPLAQTEAAPRMAAPPPGERAAKNTPPAPAPSTATWGSIKDQYKRSDPRDAGGLSPEGVSGRTLAERKVRAADAPGSIDPNRLAAVLQLAPGEVALESVRLPISGGVAWIAAGVGLEGTLTLGDGAAERDAYFVFPEEQTTGIPELEAILSPGARVARVAVIAGPAHADLRARFTAADGATRSIPGPRATARARRAALGVELLLAFRTGEAAPIERVRVEAARLAAAHPGDAGARALFAWCEESRLSRSPATYR